MKAALWAAVLTVASGVMIWHMIAWHSNGTYLEMFQWTETGKGYLTALYNLAAMLVLGILLGILMDRIGSLVGRGEAGKKPSVEEKTGNHH